MLDTKTTAFENSRLWILYRDGDPELHVPGLVLFGNNTTVGVPE